MSKLTEDQLLLVEYLIEYDNDYNAVAAALGKTYRQVYDAARRKSVKDEMLDRARDKFALYAVKAADTIVELMEADNNTEQAAVKQKAAESVLNRVGVTNHTSVEVTTEAQAGVFVLPAKAKISLDISQDEDTEE